MAAPSGSRSRSNAKFTVTDVLHQLAGGGCVTSDSEDERFSDNEHDISGDDLIVGHRVESDDDRPTSDDESEEDADEGQMESGESEVDDEDDDSSEDGQPKAKRTKKTKPTWHWVKKDLPEINPPDNHLIPKGPALEAKTPLDMFLCHFDMDLIEFLTLETNRQRLVLKRERVRSITVSEMSAFLGICLYMSVVDLPQRRMYWSPITRQEPVAKVMTCNRFEEIFSLLHASDSELQKKQGEVGYDRLFKLRTILTNLNENFGKCAEPEMFQSVDEQIIPFKGRHSLKVYMQKNPKKWGYKVWVLGGQSGYAHKFSFYGDNTLEELEIPDGVDESGKVVIRLVKDLPKGSFVFYDNYFASPSLLKELKMMEINATCTIRKNRTGNCPLLSEKDLKKGKRGAYDYRVDRETGILIAEWYDNRTVALGSNVFGIEPLTKVKRFDRKQKQHVEVNCPALVVRYNKSMGGVDKCDMLISLYRNTMKTTKWYKRVLFHLWDLCIVNSWLLYRVQYPDEEKSLVKFRLEVATSLMKYQVPGEAVNPRPMSPPTVPVRAVDIPRAVRYDNVGHLPVVMQSKNAPRCKSESCTRRSRTMCVKCKVFLCCDGTSNCYFDFHKHGDWIGGA